MPGSGFFFSFQYSFLFCVPHWFDQFFAGFTFPMLNFTSENYFFFFKRPITTQHETSYKLCRQAFLRNYYLHSVVEAIISILSHYENNMMGARTIGMECKVRQPLSSNGPWFNSWLLHFQFCSLLMAWESSGMWTKVLCHCTHEKDLEKDTASWIWSQMLTLHPFGDRRPPSMFHVFSWSLDISKVLRKAWACDVRAGNLRKTNGQGCWVPGRFLRQNMDYLECKTNPSFHGADWARYRICSHGRWSWAMGKLCADMCVYMPMITCVLPIRF